MKIKIAFAFFPALVFVEVTVFVLYHKHSNRWILKGEPKSYGNLKQNVTSSLQINRTFAASEGNSNELALLKSIRTHCSQLSFSFVSHIMQPRFKEKPSSLFLLVLIPSGVSENSNRERRNGIRSTWGNEIAHEASRVWKRVFVLGKTRDSEPSSEIKQESSVFNDVLVLNVTDTYHNLVIKSYSAMLWGLVHVNPRFLLKADDDVYIRVPYLISWLECYASDRFYGGSVKRGGEVIRRSNNKNRVAEDCLALDEYPPYCSGAFYVLSSNALPLIFQAMQRWKAILPEDAYMGLLAHELGLKPVHIPGFDPQRNLKDYGKCNWASAMALGDRYGQLQFSYVQNKLQEHSDLPRYYYQCLVTEWVGFIFLFVIPSAVFVVLFTFIKLNQIVAKGCLGINNALRFYLY